MDTSEGILSSVRYAIQIAGYSALSEERIKQFIGPPIQNSFQKEFGLSLEEANELASIFRNRYKNVDLLKAIPYDGIFDTLSILKNNGYLLGVATYKREDYAMRLLRNFGFLEYFDVVYGSDFDGKLKKSDIIEKCISALHITNRDRVVFVGDTEGDLKSAVSTGIHFIAATYGFGFKGEEQDKVYDIIRKPKELVSVCFQ